MSRPLSLETRSLAAAGVVLFAFLGLAFVALDSAFHDAALATLRDRMQGYLHAYLAGTDLTRGGMLIPPESAPDPRFDQPGGSGLYAAIVGDNILGGSDQRWLSPSAHGRDLPFGPALERGPAQFSGPVETASGSVYVLAQGVEWTGGDVPPVPLTVYIAEDSRALVSQTRVYRNTLLAWLGALAIVLVVLLLAVLRWSLAPLRRLALDLARVERGAEERLTRAYPSELEVLTRGLNRFIDSERERVKRYRHTLADLAHSLKTPLSVMRSQIESDERAGPEADPLLLQITRMEEIVAYQLGRAVASAQPTFAAPLPVEAYAEEVVTSLEKVHASRGILCEFDIDPAARFRGDPGDLMELLGNLLENAFKWARRRVSLAAGPWVPDGQEQPGLQLVIEDDGAGLDPDRVELLLQRGVRGDERVQGHGIGLAIIQDLLKAYRGELRVDHSPALGGARFTVRVP